MKNMSKLLALLLAVCLCVGVLAGCGDKTASSAESAASAEASGSAAETAEGHAGTLVVSTDQGLEQKFSPFFAASTADVNVANMT